jgi:outer membrane immunogenic protein
MKKASIAAALALAGLLVPYSASAADLPVYTKAPPVAVPVWTWTGFYAGVNIGYSWGRSSSTDTFYDPIAGTILSATTAKFDMDGVIGGGQIGYNWQWDKWVFGLETDFQGSGQKGDDPFTCAGGATGLTLGVLNGACTVGHIADIPARNVAALPVYGDLGEKLDWFGTVRGRIGPTITPTVLIYATGGLAYGDVKTTDAITGVNIGGTQGTLLSTQTPFAATFGNSSTRVGWTAGAGVEGVIGGNWTAKLEYLYIDLGSVSGVFLTPIVTPSGGLATLSYSSHITDNILRVGVNYKFGAAPVTAKY